MKISQSCPCGATAVFEDAARSYSTQASEASVQAERWRAAHSSCLDCRAELERLREAVDAIPAPSHVLDQAEIKMLRAQLAEMTEQVGALKIAGKAAILEVGREATAQIHAIGADKLAAEARTKAAIDCGAVCGIVGQQCQACLRKMFHREAEALIASRDESSRYRAALEFYATSENYMHKFERVPGPTGNDPASTLARMYTAGDGKVEAGWRPVVLDAGQRARAALAAGPAAAEKPLGYAEASYGERVSWDLGLLPPDYFAPTKGMLDAEAGKTEGVPMTKTERKSTMDRVGRDVGIYGKFVVTRVDGSSREGGKHEHCDYFVLDWKHDKFAVPAARAYADACEAEYPALADDLRKRADAALARAKGAT